MSPAGVVSDYTGQSREAVAVVSPVRQEQHGFQVVFDIQIIFGDQSGNLTLQMHRANSVADPATLRIIHERADGFPGHTYRPGQDDEGISIVAPVGKDAGRAFTLVKHGLFFQGLRA